MELGVCADNCSDVTWAHVTQQLLLSAIPWSILVVIGIGTTVLAPTWSSNGRKKLKKYDCGLASKSLTSCCTIIAVHIIQCTAFALRSADKTVDSAYHVIEFLSTLVVYIDIVLGWSYVISRGKIAVITGAFSTLLLDCCVAMAALAMIVSTVDGLKTWFSFSFLASVRILRLLTRVHCLKESVERGGTGARILFLFFYGACFVYASAMLLMTFELLEDPRDANENDTTWGLFGSILFVVSTMSTVGDTELAPYSVLGRFFAVSVVICNFYFQGPKIVRLIVDNLTGQNVGLGTYIGSDGHIVVCGSASATAVWDFLYEVYHLNHYESGDHFDREAPNIVLLMPSHTTVKHINQLLDRHDSLLFRERVTALFGEPSDHDANARTRLHCARDIVVLPNMTSADAGGDDAMNVMRTFAIASSVPHVPATCMLHSLDHRPADILYKDGNTTFLSINAFKLSMLSKSCLVPGVMTCICNLCKTVADSEANGEIWQNEYEDGLGMEIYEAPLSEAYHNCMFQDVLVDVLARSPNGNVYLIGLTEKYQDQDDFTRTRVHIHPGAEYTIKCMAEGVCGIFIAPELHDIVQRQLDDLSTGPPSRKKRTTIRGSITSGSVTDEGGESSPIAIEDSPFSMGPGNNLGGRGTALGTTGAQPAKAGAIAQAAAIADQGKAVFEAFDRKPVVISPEERAAKTAVKAYEKAMANIGQKLLASGVEMGIAAQICREPEEKKPPRIIGSNLGRPELPSLPTLSLQLSNDTKTASLRALADIEEPRILLDPVAQVGSALYSREDQEFGFVTRCHKIQERMERDLQHPPDPPPSVLKKGGHILLCIVSCTSSETHTEMAVGEFGPRLGIAHFIKPLRAQGAGQEHPNLIVLAEQLPSDWHAVAEDAHVFFVTGSPLSVADLDRAGFRNASAIAVGRCHQKTSSKNGKIADARAILVSSIIEAQFTRSAPPPVIADLAYDASVVFMPQSQAMILSLSHIRGRPPKRAGAAGSSFIELPSLTGGARHSEADQVAKQQSLAVTADEEDYDVLEAPDYAEHPRYMNGTVFVTSVMTALVANSMHNHSMLSCTTALVQAPFLLLQVPHAWLSQSYSDLCQWLIKNRNLLALGIYRNSTSSAEAELNTADHKKPSLYYMFTAPPAYKTILNRSDRILVLAPSAS